MKRYKIVSPVRFFIFVLLVTMTLVFGIVSLCSNTTEAASVNTFAQVTVQSDDTLWTIASEYVDDSMDIRDYIDEIREINDIGNNESIYVGEQIFVPIYK
ncbi:MAG: LysM peptidoglycan-binding domain-containing protein [Clostridiales bacterium]|nr:LysM peptidoglycan-binding domain-containing protein [Candidatus Crickella merdequi]